ncbi:9188_t:CDS:2 [Entrophospora sp. SA101]|nr:9188_t:CDS:2 [Entrophospora sp. SA101]
MDIIGLCLPLVDCAARLAKEAYKTAEDARYTKKTCLLLSDRLEAGSRALSDLYRHREEKEKEEKFKSSNFYNSLQSYVNAATEIKRFIDELAESGGAMKYLKSRSHKVKVNQLVKRFDDAIADLKLGINIDEFKKLDDLESVIETEFKKMSLTLETIEASLVSQTNDIKDMKLTMDTLASMNNTDSKQLDIKTIPPGDLKDPEPEEVVKRGKITKKLLKGIEPVASWNQEPSLRQNMPFFLNQLTCLYRNHYSPKIPPRCRSSSNSSINSSLGREILLELDDDDLSLDTLNLDDIEQSIRTAFSLFTPPAQHSVVDLTVLGQWIYIIYKENLQ